MCPRRHLHDEAAHAKAAHDHHHHHHADGNPCNADKERPACSNRACRACKPATCPVCLVMMSMMLLLSPPSAAAAAGCGGHGAVLGGVGGGGACACHPGYAPAGGTCTAAPDAPGSWPLRFADGAESPEEHMWELMSKPGDAPLDADEAVRMMDMMSGIYIEEEHDEHDHDARDPDENAHDEHDHDEHAHEEPGHDEAAHNEHDHDEHAQEEPGHDENAHDEHAHDELDHDEHAHDDPDHDEHADAECSGHGHLHDSVCHCDDGWVTSSANATLCVPPSAGRRRLAQEMCGGHGHVSGSSCHCESGYEQDPANALNCIASGTSAPAAGGATQWTLTAADIIAAAGANGVLAMQDLSKALPLIASCQMDPSCSLQTAQVTSSGDPHDHAGEGEGVAIWMAAVAAISFFVIPIVCAATPFWMSRVVSDDTFTMLFSLGNCFSAGLMFSLGIMHIVPETMEAQYAVPMDYPLNFLLIVVGFFVTLFLEQIPSAHISSPILHMKSVASVKKVQSMMRSMRNTISCKALSLSSHGRSKKASSKAVVGPCCDREHAPEAAGLEAGTPPVQEACVKASPPGALERANSLMPVFVFFVASQFHACLEATFVGVTSSSTDFWIIFGAVAVHKAFVSLTFGMKVYTVWGVSDSCQRWTLGAISLIWALLPALCLVIGYAVSASINAMALLVLTSLAAGTFLYIGSFEILSEEFEHAHTAGECADACGDPLAPPQQTGAWGTKPSHRYNKFLAIIIGVGVVSLMALVPHKH